MRARIEDGVVFSPYPSCEIPRRSFYAAVKEDLQRFPDKLVLVDNCTALTRSEFFLRLQRFAAGMQQHGVQPGDHICVHLSNSVDHFVAMIGCIIAGATIIQAKCSLTERELIYQMEDGDATHVLTEPQFADKVLVANSKLNLKGLFVTGDAPGFVSTSEFLHLDENTFREVPVADPENTLAAILYTSGTTGLPKGAELTHHSLVTTIYLSRSSSSASETDVALSWNPMMHSSGLLGTLIASLSGAVCVISSPMLSFEELADTVDRFKVTAVFFFPTRLQAVLKDMQRTGKRLSSLRKIGVGGSMVTDALAQATFKAFPNLVTFCNLYGLTESCGCLCSPPSPGISYNNIGFPASGVQIKIIDTITGKTLGIKETGEMCFRIPTVARGYYKRPEATAAFKDKDGWCHSGDLGYYDEHGRIYYVDRIKEMIKCMDNQVVPAELEDLLLTECEGIAEVAVVGIPHPVYGEAPAAVIVTKETHKNPGMVMEEQIKNAISSTCAIHKHLYGGVFFVDSLPKTETGKIQRSKVRENLKCTNKN